MMKRRPLRRRSPTPYQASFLAAVTACYCCSSAAAFHPLQDAANHPWQKTHSDTAASMSSRAHQDEAGNDDIADDLYNRELFSVAPMMGHTNRHYHYYFRLLSQRTHLYTEMIPSSQILRAYMRARQIYMNVDTNSDIHVEEILEVMERIKANPGKEYQRHGKEREDQCLTLDQLVGALTVGDDPVVLQLGGRDPVTLGAATAIGAAFGDYTSVNLNCGCPSNAVGGRSGGCALMQEPDTVARCVEEMNDRTIALSCMTGGSTPSITVKHRLGVRDAATFDAEADKKKDDAEAYEECSSFIRTVSLGGDVSKFHVHARLGLLGEFDDTDDGSESADRRQSLWVPGDSSNKAVSAQVVPSKRIKIDHKREQERAKRRARKATIQNRYIPPLRPNVVVRLADEFPQLEFVSNGGIQTLSDVERIVDDGLLGTMNNRVLGAMVGRAAINHPCSFASADALWEKRRSKNDILNVRQPTRGEVLQDYIRYCDKEEDRLMSMGASMGAVDVLRRRLIAVPFHLFVGEDGSDEFQRRLTKLKNKTDTVKARSILSGAASFVPPSTLDKCVDDFVPWDDIAKYEAGLKRGSAMQRVVY